MNLEPMWAKLAEYQIYAEKHGFGEAWRRMTTIRTIKAAADAGIAADTSMVPAPCPTAATVVAAWAEAAAWAAAEAAWWWCMVDAEDAERAERAADKAILYITRAIELESKANA